MSLISQRLQLKVSQKQILTPGLVQMVTVLQLNKLELKDLINQEISQNPVLDEGVDGVEELTPAELQEALESERDPHPADDGILQMTNTSTDGAPEETPEEPPAVVTVAEPVEVPETPQQAADPFDEIDFGSYFDDYLDPGYKTPA